MRIMLLTAVCCGLLAAGTAFAQDDGGNNNSGGGGGDGGGQPIDEDTREQMESTMNQDVSGVRVHTGDEASTASETQGAQAYARGDDVFLGQTETTGGERGGRLISHELSHVVQQGQQSTATEESEDTSREEECRQVRDAADRRPRRVCGRRIPD